MQSSGWNGKRWFDFVTLEKWTSRKEKKTLCGVWQVRSVGQVIISVSYSSRWQTCLLWGPPARTSVCLWSVCDLTREQQEQQQQQRWAPAAPHSLLFCSHQLSVKVRAHRILSPSFQSDNAWTLRLPSMHPHNHKTISSAGQRMSMRCTITEERGEVSGTNSITDFCHLLPVYFSYSTYVRAASINLIWSLSSSLRVKWVHILIDSMELGWGGCASGLRL